MGKLIKWWMYINTQILPATQLDMDMLDGTIWKHCIGYQAASIHSLKIVVCNWDVSLLISSISAIIIFGTYFPEKISDLTLIFQHVSFDKSSKGKGNLCTSASPVVTTWADPIFEVMKSLHFSHNNISVHSFRNELGCFMVIPTHPKVLYDQ